jgi:hypothetical protein
MENLYIGYGTRRSTTFENIELHGRDALHIQQKKSRSRLPQPIDHGAKEKEIQEISSNLA